MRITFVLPCYPWRPIGAFRVVYEYANQLVARGHEVTVVHAHRLKDEEDFWAPRGLYRKLRSKAGALRDAVLNPSISWFNLDARVRTLFVPEPTARFVPDADAIIAASWGTAPYVLRLPDDKGDKFHLIQHYAVTFGLPEAWVNTVWRAPIHNIFIARWQVEIAKRLGVEDITLVPNGIDTLLFRPVVPSEERRKRVAMLYSARDWKGPADGIRALETAKRSHPDLEAVFFGVTTRHPGIPDWIEYRQDPAQDRLVRDVYNSSTIYLCPSWSEGFPLPPLEAMACGCAVVTTACGGVVDYAEHGKNALVSPPKNPEKLAENLLSVLGDESLRLRLARAGIERAREFTWERSTDKLEALLHRCAPSTGKPTPVSGIGEPAEKRRTYAKA